MVPPSTSQKEVRVAPSGLAQLIRHLGPGMIISGAIVGSGELIATTTLGAKVGFQAFWLILLSCIVKVVVQEEMARYTIASGETALKAFDQVPGPRWQVSWVVWCWAIMALSVLFSGGGIIGGVGLVLHVVWPALTSAQWMILASALGVGLLLVGEYGLFEKLSVGMVMLFTALTVVCAILLQWTSYPVRSSDLLSGLRFQLPSGGAAIAAAVFGMTGVGATELVMYPSWCLEKGYARFTGSDDGSSGWLERARSWIQVMHWDILVAMILYTLATVAFYILGAGVLHRMAIVPSGFDTVVRLSEMYTLTLGREVLGLFLLGAFFVLFSSYFVGLASQALLWTDCLELMRVVPSLSARGRRRLFRTLVLAMALGYASLYLFIEEPVTLVMIGGIAGAVMLPIIGGSTLYLRYRRLDRRLAPRPIITLLLWIAAVLILLTTGYALGSRFF